MTPALFLLCVDVDPFTPASGCVVCTDENYEFIPDQFVCRGCAENCGYKTSEKLDSPFMNTL